MDTKKKLTGLYAITDNSLLHQRGIVPSVEMAIKGGARIIQYRDKTLEHERRFSEAAELKELCLKHNVLFIVNDDVDLAIAVNADGVHIGKDDESIHQTRAKLKSHQILGASCYNSLCRAQDAEEAGVDYVAFGRFFTSSSKPQAVQANIEVLEKAKLDLSIPIVAIGGITADNGNALIAAGADALAVIGAVFAAQDIESAAHNISSLFN